MPKNLISDYEAGRYVPDLKTVERLRLALGFSIEDLLAFVLPLFPKSA